MPFHYTPVQQVTTFKLTSLQKTRIEGLTQMVVWSHCDFIPNYQILQGGVGF